MLRLKFHHGLGDVLMFRGVLKALDQPCQLHLNPALGQQSVFWNDPLVTVVDEPIDPDGFQDVRFPMEQSLPCVGGPATKPRICLEHEFGVIKPGYKIAPLPLDRLEGLETPAIQATRQFLTDLGPYVVCHFQGTWSPATTNPDEGFAKRTVDSILDRGYGVVIINYDYVFHNPANREFAFIDGTRVRSTFRRLPMAFESLWYLIKQSSMFIGIVSGPLHAAVCMGGDLPVICLQKGTNFTTNFYDCGIDEVRIVDVDSSPQVPGALLNDLVPLASHRPRPPRIAATERQQAEFFRSVYCEYAQEMIELGRLHDQHKAGNRGQVYRTDAEVLYGLIRRWRPDAVIDFCTGVGDALSYVLLALARNGSGLCISADMRDASDVVAWLHESGVPTDRLMLFDRTDIRDLLPLLHRPLERKQKLFWVLDTDHEYEMGQWQLEHVIEPFASRSIFAKDDIVAVNNVLESDMGAVYAIRERISRMSVFSTNAAFGSTAGIPCGEQPYKGAQGRTTPGAIPFQPCTRNVDVQREILAMYPRWDPTANKMIFFWERGLVTGAN